MAARRSIFGTTREGRAIDVFDLEDAGLRARVITLGATLVGLEIPDRDGRLADVVLGFDGLEGYLGDHPYFGSTVGRYANRIARGRVELDGRVHRVTCNEGRNHLHGGIANFGRRVWHGESSGEHGVLLRLASPDGEEGFPGNLEVSVRYTLRGGVLRIDYEALTDAPTVVNLTHHSYFDLGGGRDGDILGHTLLLAADRYAPVDAEGIPTGELRPTPGTSMDFTSPRPLGAALVDLPGGIDHSYALSRTGDLAFAARLSDPESGRTLELHTTEPALQVYTASHLDGTIVGKGGARYGPQAGICLEAQRFPDTPNQPALGRARLDPGERYAQTTEHRFQSGGGPTPDS